jgi:DUF971 family protein
VAFIDIGPIIVHPRVSMVRLVGWGRSVSPYNQALSDRSTPTNIHADRAAGTLRLDWADGHVTTFEVGPLRWLCPCAFCRGEAGLPGWLDSAPTLTAEQTRLVDIQLVGQYAVAPTWGDGHHTGFYTFALLRDRCPCAECTSRRAGAAGPTQPEPTNAADHARHRPTPAIPEGSPR